jgi:hypothetical protein
VTAHYAVNSVENACHRSDVDAAQNAHYILNTDPQGLPLHRTCVVVVVRRWIPQGRLFWFLFIFIYFLKIFLKFSSYGDAVESLAGMWLPFTTGNVFAQ